MAESESVDETSNEVELFQVFQCAILRNSEDARALPQSN